MGQKKGAVLRTTFETYTVEKRIGAGGSGEVYEVRDSAGAPYAVKVLDPSRASSTRLKRFRNEINFCSRNAHRNIIAVCAHGVTADGSVFYVMPLYSGTLRDLMAGKPAPERVLPYFVKILDGVEAAHLHDVWHRDLKPENILFSTENDTLVIADFGIAHFEEEELLTAVETKNNERLANFLYSAPEQRVRGQQVDGKADIYALGLVLNEMFTGSVPLGTMPRTVSAAAPGFAYLDELIEIMLRQEPSSRPSVTEVKRQLIARGNEFISLQKLNAMKSEVIPETEVDDSLIREPIKIVDFDFRAGHLVIKLSAAPPANWVMAFQRPTSQWSSFMGSGPEAFIFHGKEASVRLPRGVPAKQLGEYAKSYVELANRQYADRVRIEHQKRLAREREELRRRVEEEEQRQKILRELRG